MRRDEPLRGLPPHCRPLLHLWRTPQAAAELSPCEWELCVRAARRAGMLGMLRARLEEADALKGVPDRVLAHLDSGAAVARHRRRMLAAECAAVRMALEGIEVVWLKGAAYSAQDLRCAAGRIPSDVDVLVPRSALARAEALLRAAGWRSETRDAYDERFYREWSHEVPPLRRPGGLLEVDLHHALVPPGSRWEMRMTEVLRHCEPREGARVLAPADQVLHACLHLLQDAEHAGRLRDLADIDALLREFGLRSGFWESLRTHAGTHRVEKPLRYLLDCLRQCFGTPIPPAFDEELSACAGAIPRRAMCALLRAAVLPPPPDRRAGLAARIACEALRARAIWQRMSLGRLALHLLKKLQRRAARRETPLERATV